LSLGGDIRERKGLHRCSAKKRFDPRGEMVRGLKNINAYPGDVWSRRGGSLGDFEKEHKERENDTRTKAFGKSFIHEERGTQWVAEGRAPSTVC